MTDDKDRVKRFYLDPRHVLMLLSWQRGEQFYLPVIEGIPEGAEIDAIHFAEEWRAFVLLVRHPTFDRVERGCMPPEVPGCVGVQTVRLRRVENHPDDPAAVLTLASDDSGTQPQERPRSRQPWEFLGDPGAS